ncbi:MAG: hypothetical protein WHV67_01775 [Thermoanaerobaculia bacterium]
MKKLIFLLILISGLYLFSSEKVMDSSGNIFSIFKGTINENPALQITVLSVGDLKILLNVPTTEDSAKEEFPNLYYSSSSRNLFIIYTKEREDGSDLYFQILKSDLTFSEPYKISESFSNTFCLNPKIYQTYKLSKNPDGTNSLLQLIHIIWWQKGTKEGAVYLNIPVVFNTVDIEAKTLIYLNDLISLDQNFAEGEISPYLYEYPEIIIPKVSENKLSIFFADLSSLSYVILDFNYDGDDTLRDRAHFPDIGMRLPYPMPVSFSVDTTPYFLFGSEEKIAFIVQSGDSFSFSYFCSSWSPITKIAYAKDINEAKEFVKGIIEGPSF